MCSPAREGTKVMSLFIGTRILLIIWLCSSCYAENIESEENNSVAISGDKLGEVINFALSEITKASGLPYKERVDEVVNVKKNLRKNGHYRLKLRLIHAGCHKYNSSCDASYDPFFAIAKEYIPIVAPLDPPLKPGREIIIHGKIPLKSKGFDITIQTGSERPVQAQLRISVKFLNDGNGVILLKHFDESWNLDQHYEGFLTTSRTFQLMIVCLKEKYEIYINGKTLASFNHMLPYEDSTHLSIFGEVDISDITNTGPRLPFSNYNPTPNWRNDDIKYQISPYVPFTAPLDSPLTPGKSISIKGTIHSLARHFKVYIQTGANETTPEAVQLRLSSFFSKFGNKIELQFYDGKWSEAQIESQVMTVGHPFHLLITCLRDKFKISIDGRTLATFEHKVPFEKATHLRVLGRVNITEVIGIDKLPPIHVINTLAGTGRHFPLTDLPMTPGRTFKIWGFLPSNFRNFSVRFQKSETDESVDRVFRNYLIYRNDKIDYVFSKPKTWAVESEGVLDFVKRGEPLQMEIKYTATHFYVRYFDDWEYSTPSTVIPVSRGTQMTFYGDFFIYGVSGGIIVKPPPPAPSPPSRLCEVNVWSLPQSKEIWLNGFECVDDNLSNSNTTLS